MNLLPTHPEELTDSMKASLFKKALKKISSNNSDISPNEENQLTFQLFKTICEYAADEVGKAGMHFATLFSRIAYLGEVFHMPGPFLYILHSYRRQEEGNEDIFSDEEAVKLGRFCISNLIEILYNDGTAENPPETASFHKKLHLRKRNNKKSNFKNHLRAYLSKIEKKNKIEIIVDDLATGKLELIYDENTQHEDLRKLIEYFQQNPDSLPATLSLIHVTIVDNKQAIPQAIVWEPDYLMDVTAISECFSGNAIEPVRYMFHKFISADNNPYILAGNITNYFLDQLLLDHNKGLSELLIESFKKNPIPFTAMDEGDMNTCFQRVKSAFYVLREAVQRDLLEIGIDDGNNKIEPSFIAPPYGIQGRLDLLHLAGININIVELKSGKPFMPNAYGLGMNHYVQTLLYNLLVDYAYANTGSVKAYILYARQNSNPLRYAPEVRAQQMEALLVRNRLMMIEHHLQGLNDRSEACFFDRLNVKLQRHLKGFDYRNVEAFEKMWKQLDKVEKQYLKAFTGFIAREHRDAKIGAPGIQSRPGNSGLWLLSNLEKTQDFNLLENLKLVADESGETNPVVTFRKTRNTYPLANFRTGDIVVLYPSRDILHEGIHSEVYKSSIIHIDNTHVKLRLRARQTAESPFTLNSLWNVEHDLLESSFIKQYRNLFRWGGIEPRKRKLAMGRIPPRKPSETDIIPITKGDFVPALSEEQYQILQKMLNAEDYFLLWGPPGTGKTSFMLKSYVQAIVKHTEDSIILLAYTNRAVDEICKAIESIDPTFHEKYIRIGSSYSTGAEYQDRLLQNLLSDIENRQELENLLNKYRIYVSTIASFAHNQDLLTIKEFDRAFIDEASQLLDPMVVPIFATIPNIIFMGDHKQLPAVSAQSDEEAVIKNKILTEMGFESTKISIFERLYKRAVAQMWDWAYDQLRSQGRMHEGIMHFPASYFYEDNLEVIASERQKSPLNHFYPNDTNSPLFKHRLLYVPTEVDELSGRESLQYSLDRNHKVNKHEAQIVTELIQAIVQQKYADDLPAIRDGIGIITPYRAQIAQIKSLIEKTIPEVMEYLTVDTVERYQGGARDIIILSFCTQNEVLFRLFSDKDVSGINRKLNVAITRAREQLILVGNKEILESSEIYGKLIGEAVEMENTNYREL